MATTTRAPQGFNDEDLTKLIALIKGADSVELKLTVPESDHRSAVAALDMDPLERADPPGGLLRHADLHAERARAWSSAPDACRAKGDDSVVKLRPVVPDDAAREAAQVARASASRSTRCRAGSSARGR